MDKFRLFYSIYLKDNEFLENTNVFFEFDTMEEAISKFYDLVKSRLSSYSGYEIFHDSPDYILPFTDLELENEWLKIKDSKNSIKHKFLRTIVKMYNPDVYEIELFKYDFFSYCNIGHENIYIINNVSP